MLSCLALVPPLSSVPHAFFLCGFTDPFFLLYIGVAQVYVHDLDFVLSRQGRHMQCSVDISTEISHRHLNFSMSLSPNTSSYSKWEPTTCLTILMSSSAFSLDRSILCLWRLMLFQLLPLFFLNSAS